MVYWGVTDYIKEAGDTKRPTGVVTNEQGRVRERAREYARSLEREHTCPASIYHVSHLPSVA